MARNLVAMLVFVLCAATAQGQAISSLSPNLRAGIDRIVEHVLAAPGAPPSASLAVVTDGRITYVRAYGDARVGPRLPARADMRYSIGSISKQFTAAAILWAAEQGKVAVDDRVSRFLPEMTRAGEVTVRQLLSHTSGYQDYWPQDYVFPLMQKPVSAARILERWARQPLDFAPGTEYQYSNTNYVLAGLIFEKATGVPLMQFLKEKIFAPLGMRSVLDIDQERLTESDPIGYMRYGLGPLRPSPKEGKGWLYAAGELAMTAEDLAKWDVALMDQRVLTSASHKELVTTVRLNNGLDTGYALGIGVRSRNGRRALSHGGEVSGFCAQNTVFPEDRTAVVVLVNQIATDAAGEIAQKIGSLLLTPADQGGRQRLDQARQIFVGLQQGKIERSLFTENCNTYFSEQALQDFASSLGPLGTPREFAEQGHDLRGGMIGRTFRVKFAERELTLRTYELPDGKWEQFQLTQ